MQVQWVNKEKMTTLDKNAKKKINDRHLTVILRMNGVERFVFQSIGHRVHSIETAYIHKRSQNKTEILCLEGRDYSSFTLIKLLFGRV